jgi:hypothetical protein
LNLLQLENLLSQGVPTSIRPGLWKTLLESETLASAAKFDYKTNVVALREQLVDVGISEYGGKAMLMAVNQMSFEKDSVLLRKGMIPVRYLRQIMADLGRFEIHFPCQGGNSLEYTINEPTVYSLESFVQDVSGGWVTPFISISSATKDSC